MARTATQRAVLLFLSTLLLTVSVVGQNNFAVRLTNSDVIKMVKAGVPEAVIVRTIQVSEAEFMMTPQALVELKHKHVPDGVVEAMMESQTGPRTVPPDGTAMEYSGPHISTAHLHQLPNVDASFRFDGKTSGKIQMRKNEIKVEKAGIPLFSVKWKINDTK